MNLPDGQSPYHDKRGVPICKGDLIRSLHFIGRKPKLNYLYHVAVVVDGTWLMVPTNYLEPTLLDSGGDCRLQGRDFDKMEVIHGHGPGDCLNFNDRKRIPFESAPT